MPEKLMRLKPYKTSLPYDTVQKIRMILYNHNIFLSEVSRKSKISGTYSNRIVVADEGLENIDIKALGDEHDRQHHSQNHTQSFKSIGPDDGLDPTLVSIGVNNCYREQYVKSEGQAKRLEYQELEAEAYHEEADRRAQNHGNEEHPLHAPW